MAAGTVLIMNAFETGVCADDLRCDCRHDERSLCPLADCLRILFLAVLCYCAIGAVLVHYQRHTPVLEWKMEIDSDTVAACAICQA